MPRLAFLAPLALPLLFACSDPDPSTPQGSAAGISGSSGQGGSPGAGGLGAGGEAGNGAAGTGAVSGSSGQAGAGGAGTGGAGGSGEAGAGAGAGGSGAGGAGAGGDAGSAGGVAAEGAFDPDPFGGARPASLYVPGGYKPGEALPLVVLLHGYGASGAIQEILFGLRKVADERNFFYIHPDGTFDGTGKRHWNATDACCGFGLSKADDVGYLTGLLDEIEKRYPVDPRRVFFVGHSNGGFMSYRMACELGGRVAGVASLAGATFDKVEACAPKAPVTVVQIHGTADETVLYQGGMFFGQPYPSAAKTAALWAGYNGCSPDTSEAPAVDVEPSISGAETTVLTYQGCKAGSAVQLWSIQGGKHIPALSDSFRFGVIDFLLAHPLP